DAVGQRSHPRPRPGNHSSFYPSRWSKVDLGRERTPEQASVIPTVPGTFLRSLFTGRKNRRKELSSTIYGQRWPEPRAPADDLAGTERNAYNRELDSALCRGDRP